ncbi:MAG: hypothetical protein AB1503_08820 [Bacillota bacterium]
MHQRRCGVLLSVELLPQVSAWVTELTLPQLHAALQQGAAYLLGRDTFAQESDLCDYIESLAEFSALAAQAFRLEREQRELEAEERELKQEANALAAGRVKDWGDRVGPQSADAERPEARSGSTPGLVATAVPLPASGGEGADAGGDLAGRLGKLAGEKGWDEAAALRSALTCAFALARASVADREELAKESKLFSRQCAVLRYRIWVLLQDNRIIRMHLAGLRARVARLQAMDYDVR